MNRIYCYIIANALNCFMDNWYIFCFKMSDYSMRTEIECRVISPSSKKPFIGYAVWAKPERKKV